MGLNKRLYEMALAGAALSTACSSTASHPASDSPSRDAASPPAIADSMGPDAATSDGSNQTEASQVTGSGDNAGGDTAVCAAPHTWCNFNCVDEQIDNNNCGGCGVTCTAPAACVLGRCDGAILASAMEAQSAVMDPTVRATPYAMAVDATNAYVTGGVTLKMPIAGGGPVSELTRFGTYWLALDATSVYVAGGTGLLKVPIGGGSAATLATGYDVSAIAVDANSVYYGVSGTFGPDGGADASVGNIGLMKVPVGGGTPTMLVSGVDPVAIVVDATDVYWANSDVSLMRVPLGGGTPTTLVAGAPTGHGGFASVAVDATNVYWMQSPIVVPAQSYARAGTVMKVPINGGTPTTLVAGPAVTATDPTMTAGPWWSFAMDAGHIYWSDGSAVMTVPVGGGTSTVLAPAPTTASGTSVSIAAVAVDATSVYWVSAAGLVMRAPKP